LLIHFAPSSLHYRSKFPFFPLWPQLLRDPHQQSDEEIVMRMSKLLLALLAGAAFTTTATTVSAQDGALGKIKNSGTITIGHRDASIPFSYYDD